jgi:hypothetical protein
MMRSPRLPGTGGPWLAGGFPVADARDRHTHRPPDYPGFGALTGSAASEGVFASSLDVR